MNPGKERSLWSVSIALFTIFAMCFTAICQTKNPFQPKVSSAEITKDENLNTTTNIPNDTPMPEATERIVNGSFETGNFSGWTFINPSSGYRNWAVTGAGFGGDDGGAFTLPKATAPQHGTYDAWNGVTAGANQSYILYQDVTLPSGNYAALTWLDKYQMNYTQFCTTQCGTANYRVQILNTSNVLLQTLYSVTTLTNTNTNTGWVTHNVDVSAYAGQTIRLRFFTIVDKELQGPGQVEIDGVSLQTATTKGTFQFSSPTYSVNENGNFATITVNRTGETIGPVTLNFTTSNGTATADQDYLSANDTIFFQNGETSKTFTIQIINDTLSEPNETLNLTLSNPSAGASLGSQTTAVLTIVDDNDGQDPSVDFDGDGKTDAAVVSAPTPLFTSTSLYENFEHGINDAGRGRVIKPISADILTDERQRIWSYDYDKLLHFRSGRGFVPLSKEVQAAVDKWNVNSGNLQTEGSTPITWTIRRSTNGTTFNTTFGTTDDVLVPADYDGDDRTDLAVWNGTQFRVLTSSSNYLTEIDYTLGSAGSDPTVVGDYDGDGRADPAVYDNATGLWSWLAGATHTTLQTQVWMPNGIPAPGDYNGDGKYDFGIQLPPVNSPDSAKFRIAFNDGSVGPAADVPIVYGMAIFQIVPGDYDGDGKTDIAQANLSGADIVWRILTSSSNFTMQVRTDFGVVATDKTVQGDYDGDGKVDLAVYRSAAAPQDGVFVILQSSNGATVTIDLGSSTDNPVGFYNTH